MTWTPDERRFFRTCTVADQFRAINPMAAPDVVTQPDFWHDSIPTSWLMIGILLADALSLGLITLFIRWFA